jgi:hypothetical protein
LKTKQTKYGFPLDMHNKAYRFTPDRVFNPVRGWIFLIFILMISCTEKEPEKLPPTISLLSQTGAISQDTTVGVNTQLAFAISANSGTTNLTNLIIQVTTPETSQRYFDTSMNIPGFSITKKFVKGLADIETWTFIIRDKNRLSDSTTLTIFRDTTVGFNPTRHIQSLTMSAQNNSDPGSFFSFASSQVYTLDQAFQNQESIDLVYYFGVDQLTMGSPGANIETGIFEGDLQNWTNRRTTRFIELFIPLEVFDNAQNDSLLIASYKESEGKRKAKLLAADKLFSFKTADSKYGIFRVISTEGLDAGTVNVEIKIQE